MIGLLVQELLVQESYYATKINTKKSAIWFAHLLTPSSQICADACRFIMGLLIDNCAGSVKTRFSSKFYFSILFASVAAYFFVWVIVSNDAEKSLLKVNNNNNKLP